LILRSGITNFEVDGGSPSSIYGAATIGFDTDLLTEGLVNLYYTNERVDDRANALIIVGSGITKTYDDTAGTLTLNINSYKGTIGDGVTSEFTITHSLNTQDIMFVARNAIAPYENINVAWAAASANTVTLDFSTPPANNSVRIGILSL